MGELKRRCSRLKDGFGCWSEKVALVKSYGLASLAMLARNDCGINAPSLESLAHR